MRSGSVCLKVDFMPRSSSMKALIPKARIFVTICLLHSAVARGTDPAQVADDYLRQESNAGRFTGSVLIARSNQIVLIKGYGFANRELNVPNTPATRFRLGSITKQFTALCILHLQDQGKLNIDDPVSRFVPDCPTNWSGITIRHLLSHTSGISNFTGFPDYRATMMLKSPVEKTIQRFESTPLEFKPGERFAYSNSGYILLGYILERVAGTNYEQYVTDTIFKPLGMEQSGYDHFETILPERAAGYSRSGSNWINAPYIDMSIPHAAGALYSSAEDFFRWYQCWRERKILSAASWKAMTTPGQGNYGFGIFVSEHFAGTPRKVLEHGGGINGFATSMKWFPDTDVFVAVFANLDSARPGLIAETLAKILFNMPVKPESGGRKPEG